jgi:copper transport outer membrane protein MctB
MINFRFHIVSLTAVFLALAIGLIMGTTFLDDASERLLHRQLDGLEDDLNEAKAQNVQQGAQIDSLHEEDEGLDQQLGQRLFGGQLSNVPVLVVSTRGLDGEVVQRVLSGIQEANGDVLGVWWLTDRLVLDDDDEVSDLAGALETGGSDVDALRTTLAGRLSEVMLAATDAAGADQLPEGFDAAEGRTSGEPTVLGRLHDAGFVDYELPEDSDKDVVELPASGVRIVVVTGQGIAVPSDEVLQPLLSDLAGDGPVPVIVSAPLPTETADGDPVPKGTVDPLIGAVREDDTLKKRVSTVDDLERVAGRVATVLALHDAVPGAPAGHYGLGDGAQSVLPPLPDGEGS